MFRVTVCFLFSFSVSLETGARTFAIGMWHFRTLLAPPPSASRFLFEIGACTLAIATPRLHVAARTGSGCAAVAAAGPTRGTADTEMPGGIGTVATVLTFKFGTNTGGAPAIGFAAFGLPGSLFMAAKDVLADRRVSSSRC